MASRCTITNTNTHYHRTNAHRLLTYNESRAYIYINTTTTITRNTMDSLVGFSARLVYYVACIPVDVVTDCSLSCEFVSTHRTMFDVVFDYMRGALLTEVVVAYSCFHFREFAETYATLGATIKYNRSEIRFLYKVFNRLPTLGIYKF